MIPLHAVIYVKNLERLTEFYATTLELSIGEQVVGDFNVLEARDGGIRLSLVAIPADIAAGITITEPPRLRDETPIKLGFPVLDIDAVRHRARAAGGQVSGPEAQWSYVRQTMCDGNDPEGNIFQLITWSND